MTGLQTKRKDSKQARQTLARIQASHADKQLNGMRYSLGHVCIATAEDLLSRL